ncbi:MAG: hypothetical protein DI616_10110 [Paracoccus denitrificans]|uniref:Uncharacterized protein n=1 Tax=Paracoccus denitrificans TaxID=266 RepID=A0A533I3Q7_PARDE|nr:MAG: hypothetical protein DI616_10110 [Paracoccus denitrificans]
MRSSSSSFGNEIFSETDLHGAAWRPDGAGFDQPHRCYQNRLNRERQEQPSFGVKLAEQIRMSLKFDTVEPAFQQMEIRTSRQVFDFELSDDVFRKQDRRRADTGQFDDAPLVVSQ